MSELEWDYDGAFPGVIEAFLNHEKIISEVEGILDHEKLLHFGIFTLLFWSLPGRREHYFNTNNKKLGNFDFYITGPANRDKIIFLISTDKDNFLFPHRSVIVPDPLEHVITGDSIHEKCAMYHLMQYNISQLLNTGFSIGLTEIECEEKCCNLHKEQIRDSICSDRLFPAVCGGWPISLDVNPEIIDQVFEILEESNRDSIFNAFLSIYFKYKLNATISYSNVELTHPFSSNEIDSCILFGKKDILIMFETSTEFIMKDSNIKNKIYNMWSLENLFNKTSTFYLTYGKFNNTSQLSSFSNSDGSNGDSPHFEIVNFPVIFKELELEVKKIKSIEDLERYQERIVTDFSSFLDEIEKKIKDFIRS